MTAQQRIEKKLDMVIKYFGIDDEKEVLSKKEMAKQIRNKLLNQNSNVQHRKVR